MTPASGFVIWRIHNKVLRTGASPMVQGIRQIILYFFNIPLQNGFAEWRPVFITGASLYIASAGYFILFGTGDTQSWNYVAPVEEEEDKRPNDSNETTIAIPPKT